MAKKPGDPEKKKPFNPDNFMKGISHVESGGGKYMKNPSSSASGLYQELYNNIDPAFLEANEIASRDDFIADTSLQNEYMRQRIYGDMSKTPRKTNLYRDADDLVKEYTPQLGDKFTFRPDEIAALSHFMGRQGARRYLAGIRDNKPYTPPGINKTPEEYLKIYNEGLPELQTGGEIMAKKVNISQDPQVLGGNRVGGNQWAAGDPLNKVVSIPSGLPEYGQNLAAIAARDQLNRYKWANFQGNMIDFPEGKGVPQFNATHEALSERGLTMDYINSYQPSNYETTLSPEQTAQKHFVGPPEMPQLGIGDYVGDIGGIVSNFGPIGAVMGGLMQTASGIGEAQMAQAQQNISNRKQEQLMYNEQLQGAQNNITQGMLQRADTNYKMPQMKYGGPINYAGQSHEGPQQGIPVDEKGNPIALSKNNPVALVEGGEVAWQTPEGVPYVFSKDSGAADKANKIFKNAEMRLGKNYTNPDPITKEGMQRELKALLASEEAKKPKTKNKYNDMNISEGLPMAKDGMGIFNWKRPGLRKRYGESFNGFGGAGAGVQPGAEAPMEPKSWSPFGGQALGIGLQAGIGAVGNYLMAKNLPEPEAIKAAKVSSPKISNVEERVRMDVDAAEARGRARTGARYGGGSKAQQQASTNYADAQITGQLGKGRSQSLMQERNINRQGDFQAQISNQQAVNRVNQLNAIREDQYNQQKMGLYGQSINSLAGGAADMTRAYQDSQFTNAMGARSGYRMVKDANGNVQLVPIDGYWEDKV